MTKQNWEKGYLVRGAIFTADSIVGHEFSKQYQDFDLGG
jgi:hypothetical protein